MVATKKRITSELLHIALVITLLRGNPHPLGIYNNVVSSNFFNDVDNFDNVLMDGPNWAFSRAANYHRLAALTQPSYERVKSIAGSYDYDLNDDDYGYDGDLNEDYYSLAEAAYNQQQRLLLLSQLNPVFGRKNLPTVQDITAYLVSETTREELPNTLPELAISPPLSSSGGVAVGTGSPSSPSDSGHDSGDESIRHSISESEDAADLLDVDPGFDETPVAITDTETNETVSESKDALETAVVPQEDIFNSDLNDNMDLEDINPDEFFDFIVNNRNDEDVEIPGAASLQYQSSRSISHNMVVEDDDHFENSLVADLFDFNVHNHSSLAEQPATEMEWAIAEEEAHLDFYKSFNDAANSDVLQTVSLREIEGLPESETETEVKVAEEATQSSGEKQHTGLEDVLEEWLETDSGVFDFFEPSPPPTSQGTFNFENLSPLDSVSSDPIEAEVDEEPSSQTTTEEKEMIQAAQIHLNGRSAPQSRGFQVHTRMPGILQGRMGDPRWQDVVNMLSLQQAPHDGSAGPLPPSLTHAFGPHPHHLHGPPPLHHHHHHHHHHPFSTAPYNGDSTRNVLLQNATLPPPDVAGSAYSALSMGPSGNIGSAVASSMHLTNNSDPMVDPGSHYKMIESSHEMVYYPNTTNNAEMNNQSTEGFFSSALLSEDELQFMDIAVSEGMYTMRMLDNGGGSSNGVGGSSSLPHGSHSLGAPNGCSSIGGAMTPAEDRMEASSDSAVSSMGSERVPPMTDPSDNEWVDPDSHPHSSHDSPFSMEYSGKGRGYDYYGKDRLAAPVPQKKHQMFGKRFQHEQGGGYILSHPTSNLPLPYPTTSGLHHPGSLDSLDMKYGCAVEFSRHQNDPGMNGSLGVALDGVHNNHTYSLPPTHVDNPHTTFKTPKPPSKDKLKKESLSRDEKRARHLNLPITTDDIINLPMDEFNERLSKYDLSEPQLSLIRDIRRRGKNKVAAQNCRKRKLDQILQLADEVQRIRERKQSLLREQQELNARRHDLKERFQVLHRHIFQSMRDNEGNSYSHHDYTLQQTADGSFIMVPKNASHPYNADIGPLHPRRDKSKDDYGKKTE